MRQTARTLTPVWWQQVKELTPLWSPDFHAEDGAYYLYESTTDYKPTGNQYTHGSMVAAYGRRTPNDVIGNHPLCGTAPNRIPSCQQVAGALGIAQTQPAPDPLDGGIPDSDMLEVADQSLQACEGNPPSKQRWWSVRRRDSAQRADSSTCVPMTVLTQAPVVKLSAPLPASDFTIYSNPSITTTPPITSPPASQPSPQMPLTPLSNCEWEDDPDEDGAPGCGCEGYSTRLPALPGTNSCAYTAVPASVGPLRTTDTSLNPTNPFPCTSTDLSNGLVAAYAEQGQVPGFAGVQCTGSNSPISTLPPVPSSTVFVGNHSFNVGKTFGNPLYSGISSLLVKACPTEGTCDLSDGKFKINDVTSYDAFDKTEEKNAGSIVMNILDSNYTPQLLPALIARAASAVNSTAQGNQMCFTKNTCTERFSNGCREADMFCRATDYVTVVSQEEGSGNGEIAAHLEVELEFDKKSDPFDKDICDLVVVAVDAGLQLLGPELEPADVAAAGEVGALCREGQALASNVADIVAVATGTG